MPTEREKRNSLRDALEEQADRRRTRDALADRIAKQLLPGCASTWEAGGQAYDIIKDMEGRHV